MIRTAAQPHSLSYLAKFPLASIFAMFAFTFTSASAYSQTTIDETGIKVTLQNGFLAYTPQGPYVIAAGETLVKIEHKFYEDVNNNGNWVQIGGVVTCEAVHGQNGNGNWTYPSGTISGLTAGRKYKSEVEMFYRVGNKPQILSVGKSREFNY